MMVRCGFVAVSRDKIQAHRQTIEELRTNHSYFIGDLGSQMKITGVIGIQIESV